MDWAVGTKLHKERKLRIVKTLFADIRIDGKIV